MIIVMGKDLIKRLFVIHYRHKTTPLIGIS